jgi:hypothetical protein
MAHRAIMRGILINFSEVIPSLNSNWKMPYNDLYSKPIHNKLINLLYVLLVISLIRMVITLGLQPRVIQNVHHRTQPPNTSL